MQQYLFEGFELVGLSLSGPGRHSAHVCLRGHFTDVMIDDSISVDLELSIDCERDWTVERMENAVRAAAASCAGRLYLPLPKESVDDGLEGCTDSRALKQGDQFGALHHAASFGATASLSDVVGIRRVRWRMTPSPVPATLASVGIAMEGKMNEEARECDRWPAELKQRLPSLPADLFEKEGPFIFMDANHLEAERQALQAAMPHPAGPPISTLSLEEAVLLAVEVTKLARFGEPPLASALRAALAPLHRSKSAALHHRLDQVRRAIWHGRRYHGRDYDPTRLVAVEPRWDRRWETILSGRVIVAFLGWLTLDQF